MTKQFQENPTIEDCIQNLSRRHLRDASRQRTRRNGRPRSNVDKQSHTEKLGKRTTNQLFGFHGGVCQKKLFCVNDNQKGFRGLDKDAFFRYLWKRENDPAKSCVPHFCLFGGVDGGKRCRPVLVQSLGCTVMTLHLGV